jgi:arginase family enzyme
VAELNPKFDIDSRSARLAARLIARVAEGVASRSPR